MRRRLSRLYAYVILAALGAAACSPEPTVAPVGDAAPVASSAAATGLPTAEKVTLNVYAAASLNAAFTELGQTFADAHPGVTPVFNFAGSQQLATQIIEGGPADVFASANPKQMDAVIAAGDVASGTARTFAGNRLVVVYPIVNRAAITTLSDLAKPGLKIVLAAPSVPVGAYALEFLQKASADPAFTAAYSETVMANVVSLEDDVMGVMGKIGMDEADAGIAYASDMRREGASGDIGILEIPDELNVIAEYPLAVTARSAHPEIAQTFVDFVLSAEGQAILEAFGFQSVASLGHR
jgi:molybdate transport system substrate-binding protein